MNSNLVNELIGIIVDDLRFGRLDKLTWSQKTEYIIGNYHKELHWLGMLNVALLTNGHKVVVTWESPELIDFFNDVFLGCLMNEVKV